MTNQTIQTAFDKAKKIVDQYDSFILVSHEYTDGDDLGGALALSSALRQLEKKTCVVAKGGVPDQLLFLPGNSDAHDELTREALSADVLITLGCGDIARTGFTALESWDKPIINIDHHHDTKQYGTVNVWDEHMAANCELIYLMLKHWGIQINRHMAMALLTGIFTDTGGFRHANVHAQTFEISADLLRRGAKLDVISRFTYSQKEVPTLKAWSVALENARFDPQRKVIYTIITEEDLERVGASEDDLDGIVELLNTIPEARFSMLLKQRGDEVKGSLRSEPYKGVDVSQIARAFGGGGHKLAAGFKFKGKIEKTPEGWKIM